MNRLVIDYVLRLSHQGQLRRSGAVKLCLALVAFVLPVHNADHFGTAHSRVLSTLPLMMMRTTPTRSPFYGFLQRSYKQRGESGSKPQRTRKAESNMEH